MALGERSNEFVVREGSIKSARFVEGRERHEVERRQGHWEGSESEGRRGGEEG